MRDLRLKSLGLSGWSDMESGWEPRCQVTAVTTTENREHKGPLGEEKNRYIHIGAREPPG